MRKQLRIILITLLVNILVASSTLIFRENLPPEIPLFYGRPESQGQLAPSLFLLIPPAISIFFALLNIFLIKILKDDFAQKTLIVLTIVTTTLSTIGVLKIMFLVGSF